MKNAILSILRHALTFGGGAVIANNPSIDPANIEGIIGAIIAVVGAVWGSRDEYKAEKKSRF